MKSKWHFLLPPLVLICVCQLLAQGGPTVATNSLPGGTVGTSYSANLTATGGSPPYGSWTIVSGALPPGFQLNPGTNQISGTPTTSGTFSFGVTVRDSTGATSPAKQLPITISPPPVVNIIILPSGTTGVVYSAQLSAAGGTLPYTFWTVNSGGLPPGVALSSTTGVISGTPTSSSGSPFIFSVTVRDTAGAVSPGRALSIVIVAPLTIASPPLLLSPTEGNAYSQIFTATGGTGGYTWTATGLPSGLSMSSAGVLSGILAAGSRGNYTVAATVRDSSNATAFRSLPLTIYPILTLSCTPTTGPVRVGTPYSATCTAAVPPIGAFNWSTTGTLPAGLTLIPSGASATISGTPTSAGTYSYSVSVADSITQQSASQPYSGNILPPPVILTLSCTPTTGPVRVGAPYSATCTASGGTASFSWSMAGTLPAGLRLGLILNPSAATISGTPTSAGPYNYSVNVSDSGSPVQTANQTYSGNVLPAPTVLTLNCNPTSGPVRVGTPYSASCTASGGTASFSWSTAGALPAGLSLNPSGTTATISGTPTSAGPYNYTVNVSDSGSPVQTANLTYSGNVLPAPTVLTLNCNPTTGPVRVGTPYSATCTAIGGTASFNWSTTGSLPAGLSLNPSGASIIISGTPLSPGAYNYSIIVTDSSSPVQTATQSYSGNILPAPTVLTLTCAPTSGPTTVGIPYSANCIVSGGTAPYNWTSTDALPSGLRLTDSGTTATIFGRPTVPGPYSYGIKVTDSSTPPQTATQTFSGTAVNPPLISLNCTPTTGPTSVGIAYSATCTVTGGTAPYNWSSTGSLPSALTLNAQGATATISGTPSSGGAYSYSVRVTDAAFPAQSTAQSYSGIVVNPTLLSLNCTPSSGPTVVGTVYSSICTATGGSPPYNWSSTGTLPAGLGLTASGATAAINGTPTAPGGVFNYGIRVTDSSSPVQSVTQPFSGTISPPSIPAPLTIPTQLRIITTSALSFNFVQGGSALATQAVSVVSTNPDKGVAFSAVLSCPWLSVSPTSGVTPQVLTLTADPASLATVTYSCTVAVSAPSFSASASIDATLVVSSPLPTASPSSLAFSTISGSQTPVFKTVSLGGSATSVSYTSDATTKTGGVWLSVSPASGSTPSPLSVKADPTGLLTGKYDGTVTVTSGGKLQTVDVSLSISSLPLNVGPSSLTFNVQAGSASAPATISVFTGNTQTVTFQATATQTWLSLTQQGSNVVVTANGGNLPPGTYAGFVVISASGTNPPQQMVPVTLNMLAPPVAQPILTVSPPSLTFNLTRGGTPSSNSIFVSNAGGGSINFSVSASTVSGDPWLTVIPSAGKAMLGTPAAITVIASPLQLSVGTYSGQVVVSGGGQSIAISVTMAITGNAQTIVLSQTALAFTTVAQGGVPPSKNVAVINAGVGAMAWTATPRLPSGFNWLTVFAPTGTAVAGAAVPSSTTISVDPGGLAAGTYYGSVLISANASNSPQTISVAFNVLDSAANPGAAVNPASVVFTDDPEDANRSQQSVTLFNIGTVPISYSTVSFSPDGNWFSLSPASGTVAARGTTAITIQRNTGLTPGIRTGTIRVLFADGTLRTIDLLSVTAGVTSPAVATASVGGALSATQTAPTERQANCTSLLTPKIISLSDGFSVRLSQAVTIRVEVVDGCSSRLVNNAIVAVKPTNKDQIPPPLKGEGNGMYSAQWVPADMPANVAMKDITLQVQATLNSQSGAGGSSIMSGVMVNPNVRTTRIDEVKNSASYLPSGVVAPGALIAIFGQDLADGNSQASAPPISTNLNGTEARLNDQLLPLFYASPGQVNAQVLYNLPPNTNHTLVVTRNGADSNSTVLTASDTLPAVFTLNQQGFAAGAIVNGQGVVGPDNPVHSGDIITVYTTGLGAVDQKIDVGAVSPESPPSQVLKKPQVLIGGKMSEVTFAGLSPRSVALYQINVKVPDGIGLGDDVSLLILIDGQASQAGVTLSVR